MTDVERKKLENRSHFMYPKILMRMVQVMSDEQAGKFTKALQYYVTHHEDMPGLMVGTVEELAYQMFKDDYQKQSSKYLETCSRNSKNAQKRWGDDEVGK